MLCVERAREQFDPRRSSARLHPARQKAKSTGRFASETPCRPAAGYGGRRQSRGRLMPAGASTSSSSSVRSSPRATSRAAACSGQGWHFRPLRSAPECLPRAPRTRPERALRALPSYANGEQQFLRPPVGEQRSLRVTAVKDRCWRVSPSASSRLPIKSRRRTSRICACAASSVASRSRVAAGCVERLGRPAEVA